MQMLSKEKEAFILKLSRSELLILHNALNEVVNGIEVPEFSTRMGAEVSEVESLLGQTHNFLGEKN
jgi:hypothetical protein